jgi:putative ABC transport system permease protein
LTEVAPATAYVPIGQGEEPLSEVNFELRAPVDPETFAPAVRAVAADMNPAISLDIGTLEAQVARSLARPRLLAALSGFFGALALALAVIGLYGTMSYSVTRRRKEIGVRMALGALNVQVLGMLLGEAGRMIAWGLGAGIVLSLAGTRLVTSFLFGVTATDPTIFAASVLLLAVVALFAALVPAWRAARLDPLAALRED